MMSAYPSPRIRPRERGTRVEREVRGPPHPPVTGPPAVACEKSARVGLEQLPPDEKRDERQPRVRML